MLIAEISSFLTDNLLKRLLGSPPLTDLSISELEELVLDKLITMLEKNFRRLGAGISADQDLNTLWRRFNDLVAKEARVTRDGYRADLTINLRDAIYVFEIRKATLTSGELGPEIIAPSHNLRKAIENEMGKATQLVFVSPKGTPKYIAKLLGEASGAVVFSIDSEDLEHIGAEVVKEWLADTFNPTYSPEKLYRIDEEQQRNLGAIPEDERLVVEEVSRGLSRNNVAQKLSRDRAWIDKAWKNAVQKLSEAKD